MIKKTMNSLFLNYLLQSQDNIEANVEKWTKDFNIAENIDEISETLNEHIVFIMACCGKIGWCLHNFATICIFTYIFIDSCKCPGDIAKPSKTTRYLSNYEGEIL